MTYQATTNLELIKEKTQNINIPYQISPGEEEFINILCSELGKEDMKFDRIYYHLIDFNPTYNKCKKNICLERKGDNQTRIYTYGCYGKEIIVNIPFIFFFAHLSDSLDGPNANSLRSVIQEKFEILNIKKNIITASYFNTKINQRYNFFIFKRFFNNKWYIKDSRDNKYTFNQLENTYTNNLIEKYNAHIEQKKDHVINIFFDK